MSKKVTKSIQATIITLIVGMILPKVFDISGNLLLDKFLWKVILSVSFNVATIIVGVLYAGKMIKGKVAGGKSRIGIYFIMIAIFASVASIICAFIKEISPIINIALGATSLSIITLLIVKLIVKCGKTKQHFKITQEKSIMENVSRDHIKRLPSKVFNDNTIKNVDYVAPIFARETSDNIRLNPFNNRHNVIKKKTLYELWNEKDKNEKCLTATNDENSELKWVRIYKGPYPNGKFYGYIMMQDAHHAVNGEIYFAERPIWKVCL